jgi:DNA replication protein DnaC
MDGFRTLGSMLDAARELPPPPQTSPQDGSLRPPAKVNGVPRLRWEHDTFAAYNLAEGDRAAYDQCHRVARGDAWCAVLAGGPGSGKTHLAIATMHEFDASTFWKVPDLLAELRRLNFDDDKYELYRVMDSLQTDRVPGLYGQTTGGMVALRPEFQMRRLLVLDELGVQKATEFADEQLYRVLDARYDMQLPTIITTNQPKDRIDERIRSRYASGLVVVKAPDHRR